MASWSFSTWLNHLKMTWLGGACRRRLPFAVRGEGPGVERARRGAGVRPASGSGAGFVRKTASGSGSGPGPERCGRSAPRSRRRDADLHKQAGFSESGGNIGGVDASEKRRPSLNASPSGRTSLTQILLFFWPSMCPVTAKPGGNETAALKKKNHFREANVSCDTHQSLRCRSACSCAA